MQVRYLRKPLMDSTIPPRPFSSHPPSESLYSRKVVAEYLIGLFEYEAT